MFRTTFAALAASLVLLSLPACETQRQDVCGEVGPGGGPPVARTREQELCETARLRVHDAIAKMPNLDEMAAQHLYDRSFGWEDVKTTDGLVTRLRADAGDAFADAVARAISEARQYSKKPFGASCADPERCLVRGAARGARFGLDDALDYFRRNRPPLLRPEGGSEY